MATVSDQTHITHDNGLEFREACLPDKILSDTFILFCHGVAHQANFFDEWSTQLALNDGIRSAALSYRGHGNSTPITSLRELNQLSIQDYKEDVLATLEKVTEQARNIVCIGHSMGGRILYDLLHSGQLPDTVSSVVLVNPVPHNGVLYSATQATFQDMRTNHRATPLTFPYALLLRKNIKQFFQSAPERTLSLFFSSDSENDSRLASMTAQEFCDQYISSESSLAVREAIFPAKVSPQKVDIPMFIFGSTNDRIISSRDLEQMKLHMERHGYYGSSLQMHDKLSHDSPLDVDGPALLETIVSRLKESALLQGLPMTPLPR